MPAVLLAAGAARAEDWTARLPALAPALRACLAGDAAAFAVEAREEAGAVVVRLWRDGLAERCEVAEGTVRRRATLPGAPPPDAAATAFFLERRCVDARRVDHGGQVLGWLAYPAC